MANGKMTKQQLITALFQAYDKQGQQERIDLFYVMLNEVPTEILEKVVIDCINTEKFMPTIAVLKDKCLSLMHTIYNIANFKEWDEAWEEIITNIRNVGPYQIPKWSSPIIHSVVCNYGWNNLCCMDEKNIPIVKAQMRDNYNAICERETKRRHHQLILQGKTEIKALNERIQEARRQEISGQHSKCIGQT